MTTTNTGPVFPQDFIENRCPHVRRERTKLERAPEPDADPRDAALCNFEERGAGPMCLTCGVHLRFPYNEPEDASYRTRIREYYRQAVNWKPTLMGRTYVPNTPFKPQNTTGTLTETGRLLLNYSQLDFLQAVGDFCLVDLNEAACTHPVVQVRLDRVNNLPLSLLQAACRNTDTPLHVGFSLLGDFLDFLQHCEGYKIE